MKLLVFSHAAVLEVNRAVFQVLAARHRVDVTMVVPRRWRGDLIEDLEFAPAASDHGIRVVPIDVAGSGNGSLFFHLGRLERAIGRAVGDFTPDHVFVDEEPWSLSALQAFEAFRHQPHSFYTKQNLRKEVPPPFSFMQKKMFGTAAMAFAVSREVGEVLRWKGYAGPIHELPHSYDASLFRRLSPEGIRAARRALRLPEDKILIGYVGRMAEEKGVLDLVDAMRSSAARGRIKNPHFAWIGNGPLAGDVLLAALDMPLGYASVSPAVRHGAVSDAIGSLDLLVLPSRTTPRWKEQFGRVVIEAMACGVPVIGSSSGEIPHLIDRTGGGLVFREGDAEDLLAKIETLALDERERARKGAAGAAAASRDYTHEAVADLIFEKVSGQKP